MLEREESVYRSHQHGFGYVDNKSITLSHINLVVEWKMSVIIPFFNMKKGQADTHNLIFIKNGELVWSLAYNDFISVGLRNSMCDEQYEWMFSDTCQMNSRQKRESVQKRKEVNY